MECIRHDRAAWDGASAEIVALFAELARSKFASAFVQGVETRFELAADGAARLLVSTTDKNLLCRDWFDELLAAVNAAFETVRCAVLDGNPAFLTTRQLKVLRLLARLSESTQSLFFEFSMTSRFDACPLTAIQQNTPASPRNPELLSCRLKHVSRRRVFGREFIIVDTQERPKRELRIAYEPTTWEQLRIAESAQYFVKFRIRAVDRLLTSKPAPTVASLVDIEEISLLDMNVESNFKPDEKSRSSYVDARRRRGGATNRRATHPPMGHTAPDQNSPALSS